MFRRHPSSSIVQNALYDINDLSRRQSFLSLFSTFFYLFRFLPDGKSIDFSNFSNREKLAQLANLENGRRNTFLVVFFFSSAAIIISCVRGATPVNMHVTLREQKPFTLDFRQHTGIYVPARNRRKLHLPQRAALPDTPASRLRATERYKTRRRFRTSPAEGYRASPGYIKPVNDARRSFEERARLE